MKPGHLLPLAAATASAVIMPIIGDSSEVPAPLQITTTADGGISESVYEIIRDSGRGNVFSRLLDGHGRLRSVLAGDGGVFTVFVPTDEAFRKLDGGLEKSDKILVGEILEYHVLQGLFPVEMLGEVAAARTLLEEGEMGHRQRVRVEAGASGVEINFFSRVLGPESKTGRNGIVHFVDNVIIPPPRHDHLIEAMPGLLDIFSGALDKTGVSGELRARGRGVTVLAPSDAAWDALEPDVRGFLFSEAGAEYLKALVRYHIIVDEVIYTQCDVRRGALRGDESVKLDGTGFLVRDVPARDGVVHVLEEVMFPEGDGGDEGVIGVEEVRQRLERLVRQEEGFESREL